MKKFLLSIVSVVLIVCLTGCSNGFGSMESAVSTIEEALEKEDIDTLIKLLHKDANAIFKNFIGESQNQAGYLNEVLTEQSNEYSDVNYNITVKDDNLHSDWEDSFEEVCEIINSKCTDIDTSKIIFCELESYSYEGRIDDGFMLLYKDGMKWKILILLPWC